VGRDVGGPIEVQGPAVDRSGTRVRRTNIRDETPAPLRRRGELHRDLRLGAHAENDDEREGESSDVHRRPPS
jgi:hypothetical protein